jgi:hypothetical protein
MIPVAVEAVARNWRVGGRTAQPAGESILPIDLPTSRRRIAPTGDRGERNKLARIGRRSRPARAAVVVSGRTLDPAQEQLWRTANEDVGSGELARMKRGLAALRRLEREFELQAAASAVRQGVAETVALEAARGEAVEISARPESRGRVRIRTRDGLETLERAGVIDPIQYRAGLLYRDLYEATDPERDLRSHLEGLERRGKAGDTLAEAWAERKFRLARTVAMIEAKVRLADRNDRAVRMLREVAGNARCVGAMFGGGGSQALGKRALVLALEVCAVHFGLRGCGAGHALTS